VEKRLSDFFSIAFLYTTMSPLFLFRVLSSGILHSTGAVPVPSIAMIPTNGVFVSSSTSSRASLLVGGACGLVGRLARLYSWPIRSRAPSSFVGEGACGVMGPLSRVTC